MSPYSSFYLKNNGKKKLFLRYFHKPCTLETGILKNRMNCLLYINIQCFPLIGRTQPEKCPSQTPQRNGLEICKELAASRRQGTRSGLYPCPAVFPATWQMPLLFLYLLEAESVTGLSQCSRPGFSSTFLYRCKSVTF